MADGYQRFLAGCYHEASHSVVAEALGLAVAEMNCRCTRYVENWGAEDAAWVWQDEDGDSWDSRYRWLGVILAGFIGEMRCPGAATLPIDSRFFGDFQRLRDLLAAIQAAPATLRQADIETMPALAETEAYDNFVYAANRAITVLRTKWRQVEVLAARIRRDISEGDLPELSDAQVLEMTTVQGDEVREIIRDIA